MEDYAAAVTLIASKITCSSKLECSRQLISFTHGSQRAQRALELQRRSIPFVVMIVVRTMLTLLPLGIPRCDAFMLKVITQSPYATLAP